MGAWAADAFGNDDACEWAGELVASKNLDFINATLSKTLAEEYLEAPTASEALAAAEVLAKLRGHLGIQNAYTEQADKWVQKTKILPGEQIIGKALEVIDKILSGSSELKELWHESSDFEEWEESVLDIKARLIKPTAKKNFF